MQRDMKLSFNEQKQKHASHACVLHLGTFLVCCRPDNYVNGKNLNSCGGRAASDKKVLIVLSKQRHRSYQFYSWDVDTRFQCRTAWTTSEINVTTGNNIFRLCLTPKYPCATIEVFFVGV